MGIKTNWYVVDGGPSVGKSTVLGVLRELRPDFTVVEEAATQLILEFKLQHRREPTKAEVYSPEFQTRIHAKKLETENGLDPNDRILLDRGIPADAPYIAAAGLDANRVLADAQNRRYAGVFLLERLPTYERNGIRVENEEEAREMGVRIRDAYLSVCYSPIHVPVLPLEERARFISERLG